MDFVQGVINDKKSNRHKLFMKIGNEYDAEMRKYPNSYDGDKHSEKIWKELNLKYKNDYLKAVLKDAKVPVTKQNLQKAHEIISAKDTEYTRYDKKRR